MSKKVFTECDICGKEFDYQYEGNDIEVVSPAYWAEEGDGELVDDVHFEDTCNLCRTIIHQAIMIHKTEICNN